MPGCRNRLLGAGVVLACVTVAAAAVPAHADGSAGHHTVFSFADPQITESSGLVARGGLMFTMNDSGHGPQVYAVDQATGATVTTTTYTSDRVEDVEALAPGRGGDLWVGDIGDNTGHRRTVAIYHLPATDGRLPAEVDATRFDLGYPDGPRDAETLLVMPRTGRVYVVSKALFGGTVYQAPAHLRRGVVNRLSAFAQVPGLVTDGAFFPDGRHLLLRTYNSASLYTFPGFEPLGTMTLPRQKQGEGIAVSPDGRVYLSSEGVHSAVVQVSLPKQLRHALAARPKVGQPPVPSGSAAPRDKDPAAGSVPIGVSEGGRRALLVVVLGGAAALLVRASRRRSRRRR